MKKFLHISCAVCCVLLAGAMLVSCKKADADNGMKTSPIVGTWTFDFTAGGGIERAGEYVFTKNGKYSLKTWDNGTGANEANTSGTWKVKEGLFSLNDSLTTYTLEFSADEKTMTWKNAVGSNKGKVAQIYTRK